MITILTIDKESLKVLVQEAQKADKRRREKDRELIKKSWREAPRPPSPPPRDFK